jgi:hypothetical protein
VLALVIGLSVMRIHASIELLHLGLQRLLKVGLTLPVLLRNQPYKCKQSDLPSVGRCCGRYRA